MLHCTSLERVARDKHKSLFGPFVRYEENEYGPRGVDLYDNHATVLGYSALATPNKPEAVFLVVCDPSMNKL